MKVHSDEIGHGTSVVDHSRLDAAEAIWRIQHLIENLEHHQELHEDNEAFDADETTSLIENGSVISSHHEFGKAATFEILGEGLECYEFDIEAAALLVPGVTASELTEALRTSAEPKEVQGLDQDRHFEECLHFHNIIDDPHIEKIPVLEIDHHHHHHHHTETQHPSNSSSHEEHIHMGVPTYEPPHQSSVMRLITAPIHPFGGSLGHDKGYLSSTFTIEPTSTHFENGRSSGSIVPATDSSMRASRQFSDPSNISTDAMHAFIVRPVHGHASENSADFSHAATDESVAGQAFIALIAPPSALHQHHESDHGTSGVELLHEENVGVQKFQDFSTDLQQVKTYVVMDQAETGESRVFMDVKVQTRMLAYLMLTVCVLALSSLGLAGRWFPEINGIVVTCWRTQTWALVLIPAACREIWRMSSEERKVLMRPAIVQRTIVAGMLQLYWVLTFFIALQQTTITKAFLFNQAHVLILVVWRLLIRDNVLFGEILGVGFGFIGAILAAASSGTTSAEISVEKSSFSGDMIAFSGAFAAAGYLTTAKKLREVIPPFTFSVAVNFTNCAILFLVALFGISDSLNISFQSNGYFGWLTKEYLLFGLFLGVFTGAGGGSLSIILLRVLPGLVISVVMLLEPIVGSYLAALFGKGGLPDLQTLVGALLLITGLACISAATQIREITIDLVNYAAKYQQRP